MTITFQDIVNAIAQLGFPIVLSIYLLINLSRNLERIRGEMAKQKIALYLMLQKMDAIDEYEEKLRLSVPKKKERESEDEL